MGSMFKVVRPDGSVEYTDVPAGAGRAQSIRPGEREPERKPYDPKFAEQLIQEAQKRIPKVVDYLEYVDYLRHNSPIRFDRVMDELRRQDPQTWLKLQKYPQFRPLRETAIGLKAGEKMLSGGLGLATGSFTGSTEKWMETTLKDLMKRDRFGPFAEVLGRKATTLSVKPTVYSNSRLGQYLKGDDVRAVAAAKATAKELDSARAGLRAARGMVVTRVMGPVVDLGMGMMDPEKASGIGTEMLRRRAQKLFEKGVIDAEQWAESQQLLSSGRFVEMQKLMDDAVSKYVKGR